MDFYWITQLGDADFCPPVKDISVAHFLLIHCSCSHASRLVISLLLGRLGLSLHSVEIAAILS